MTEVQQQSAATAGVDPAWADLGAIGKQAALSMLERMVVVRQFEQTAYLRFLQGEIPGTLHQSQGQEAVAVGVCTPLRTTDWITSTHRPHGHALAKGMDSGVAMAEIYGREPGALGGRGGSMHRVIPSSGSCPRSPLSVAASPSRPGWRWRSSTGAPTTSWCASSATARSTIRTPGGCSSRR